MPSRGVAICTRAADDLGGFREAFAAIGLDTIALPVTQTVPPADPEALRRAFASDPGRYLVMVASPRAAAAVVEAGNAKSPWPIWAIGEATARVLRDAGFTATVPELQFEPDGDAFARAALAEFPPPRRIIVPRAEGGREAGIARLRAAGCIVTDVVAYRTMPIAPAARDAAALAALDRTDAIACVFAPSQVTALGRADLARYAAIGRTTATALVAAGVASARIAVAATPTPAGLADAIQTVYPRER